MTKDSDGSVFWTYGCIDSVSSCQDYSNNLADKTGTDYIGFAFDTTSFDCTICDTVDCNDPNNDISTTDTDTDTDTTPNAIVNDEISTSNSASSQTSVSTAKFSLNCFQGASTTELSLKSSLCISPSQNCAVSILFKSLFIHLFSTYAKYNSFFLKLTKVEK